MTLQEAMDKVYAAIDEAGDEVSAREVLKGMDIEESLFYEAIRELQCDGMIDKVER